MFKQIYGFLKYTAKSVGETASVMKDYVKKEHERSKNSTVYIDREGNVVERDKTEKKK